jgi:P4 family phage/plasmid primase-like protien
MATVEGVSVASHFLADMFGASTVAPVFICSLPNADAPVREPRERHVATRERDHVETFCRKWDRKDRALYFCTATVKPGATTRSKATLAELNALHVDIDFKSIAASPQEAENKLAQVMLLPSKVIASGGGLHAYWLFNEALEATPDNIERAEALLRLLADHLGGDLACAEASRLMRLPGTHNSKNGTWTEVRVIAERPLRYELDDLADWLEVASPIIVRKPATGSGNGRGADINNPWLAVAERFGVKPAIDVEARLAAMTFRGAADTAIHPTQVSVSAALLNRGHSAEETVEILLAATRAAAGHFAERWNWQREERAIRHMCDSWLAKHPDIKNRIEPETSKTAKSSAQSEGDEGDAEPRTKARAPKSKGRKELVAAIVAGVIDTVRRQGGDLLLTGGELYLYDGGIWRIVDAAAEQHLKVLIQIGLATLKQPTRLGTLHAAWKLLREHPDLHDANIAWDRVAGIVVNNGVLDLDRHTLSPWQPQHYLRRKFAVAFDLGARAPLFDHFLASLFADRDDKTRKQSLGLLQEFFGACFAIGRLNREQRRALLLIGPSRVGKTELARIIRLLLGGTVAAPAVREIGERFGLAGFADAVAWIRDDAINEGDKLDPERFKTIVTGEPIDIERKNRTALPSVRLCIPVILTANILPTARDSTDAIFNRCLVVELTNVFTEEDAVAARRQLGVPPGQTLADFFIEREGPGILNWALDGLDRLLKRGRFAIPDHVAASLQRFKDDSNAVAAWARTMLERSDSTMIERTDLLCAFHGWWREEMGDDVRLLGGRWLWPKFRAACPWVTEIKIRGTRFFAGVALTEAGLHFWEQQSQDATHNGRGSKGSATQVTKVNQPRAEEDIPFDL